MDAIASLREGLGAAHWLVEGTMEGITSDQAHKQPGGNAHCIAALYAHLVSGEDMILNGMIQGKAPLAATSHAGKTGISQPPPMEGGDWAQWGKDVRVDIPALRQYAQAVYAVSDAYIAGLKPEDLDQKLNHFPDLGPQTLNWYLQIIIGHAHDHIGEVSALKGIQGLKGYPF